ncbi:hypothetical protein GCM10022408_03250 [Hymenobacter fastidiosus]|uniref:DUF4890 domain-containing protein n=1 Tax=Hymenobacter fastidiosus TaxID=486264 RepID=A0ABP7RDS2_9BACT
MKKILLLLAAFSFSAGVVSAQTVTTKARHKGKHEQAGKAAKTPEQRADHAARRMTKSLNLSDAQAAQVRQLYLAQAQEKQADRTRYAADANKAGRRAGMQADRQRYDARLREILTADQYTRFAQQRVEQKARHKEDAGQRTYKMKAKS